MSPSPLLSTFLNPTSNIIKYNCQFQIFTFFTYNFFLIFLFTKIESCMDLQVASFFSKIPFTHIQTSSYNYTLLLLMATYNSITQLSNGVFNHFPMHGILTIFRNLLSSYHIQTCGDFSINRKKKKIHRSLASTQKPTVKIQSASSG